MAEQKNPVMKVSNPIPLAFFCLLLTVLGSSFIGDAAWEVFDTLGVFGPDASTFTFFVVLVAAIAVFGAGITGLFLLRQRLLPTRAKISEQPPDNIFGLVAGLSSKSPAYGPAHPLADAGKRKQLARTLKLADIALDENDRKRLIDDPLTTEDRREALKLLHRFPWQQTLRVIHRVRQCNHICVLTTERSDKEVEEFKAFFDAIWDGAQEDKPVIETPVRAINFEDYDEVAQAATNAVDTLKEKWKSTRKTTKMPADCICIDITAGMKIFSIAAAVVTLNQSLNFAYANNDGIVRFFDAQITPISEFE